MLCPVCTDERLSMTERQGIEIDYCPKCRGVWLDRGELDKLIERATQEMDAAPAPAPRVAAAAQPPAPPQGVVAQPVYAPVPYPPGRYDEHRHGHGQHRKSFWKDLFD